jgi:putative ABC transport system permease protein
MSEILKDIRFGLRMLAKNRAFTIVAVLTAALGIGANTTIFSVVNAAMIRPLPYPNAGRLMDIYHDYKKLNLSHVTVDPDSYLYYRDHATSFDNVAAFTSFRAPQNLTGTGQPDRVITVKATANFFPALGTQPALGRTFTAQEDSPGANRVAVLSYGMWNTRFGHDPAVVGRQITLDGANYDIVGVMPKDFQYPDEAELWIPMAFTPAERKEGSEYLHVIATRKPEVSADQAEAEMGKLSREVLARANDVPNRNGWSANAMPLRESSVADVRSAVWVLLAAVGCVLLIACANLVNLLLARATARQKEFAIRVAMGASRWRMVRQLLIEGVLLGLLGGVLGLLLGYFGLDILLKLVPIQIPSYVRVQVDANVLFFTFALATLTGLVFSALPALQLTKAHPSDALKEGGRTATGTRHTLSSTVVIAQLAMSLILLVAAGLLIKTFMRIQQADPGFDPHNVLTFHIEPPAAKYKTDAQLLAFYDQVLERERRLPGVTSAGITSEIPLTSNMSSSFSVSGKTYTVQPHAHVSLTDARYFGTMRIPVERGRTFSDADREGSLPVAMIDDVAAKAYFQNDDPIGHKVMFTFEGTKDARVWREIVGVVHHVKHSNPLEDETKGQVFLPYAQLPMFPGMSVVMRTQGDPLAVASEARREVLNVDPLQPIEDVASMDDVLNKFIAQPRFNMVLLAGFAGLALFLSAVGVYGVMTYSVSQRTREFAIRMALGASGANVQRFVLKEALRLALVGLGAGIIGAFIATRALASLLFGVKAFDVVTFVGVSVLLAMIALLASYLPARRATKVDPMMALRSS